MSTPVVLLASDIVDSTDISARLGEAPSASLWSEHDRRARDLLIQWHGREIDKSDGFLLVFDSVNDASGYAVDYHRLLATLRPALHARVGIHIGAVQFRANPADHVAVGAKALEVDGLAKVVAARAMALARPGQTLLTSSALIVPADNSFTARSCGHWIFKGIGNPIELFEIAKDDHLIGPPEDAPKAYRVEIGTDGWSPLRRIANNLPEERDQFVGQHNSLSEIARRFDGGARLITVLGPGGAGKTRLALRYGRLWMGDFPGGAWFCDLSQTRGTDGLVFSVANALNVPVSSTDGVGQLGAAIAGREDSLLILDNFEQIVGLAEETVGRWLELAPRSRLLVTSREVLGIRGENVLRLRPLTETEGVTLFRQRASEADPEFTADIADAASLSRLANLLDGLPLAIELAAARSRLLPPQLLIERMSERFRLLTTRGGRQPRQATLRAAFDWSWELLTTSEKRAFARLSVFEGGFDLNAAEAVVGVPEDAHNTWPADVVQSLVEKSLVRRQDGDRFALLLSLKDYAAEQLCTAGRFPGSGAEAQHTAWRLHWEHYASFDEARATAGGCVEIDNLIGACKRARGCHSFEAATATLFAAWGVLALRGPYQAAVDLAEALLTAHSADDRALACANFVKGSALFMLGQSTEARKCLDEGIVLIERTGDLVLEARLRGVRAEALTKEGQYDAARNDFVRANDVAARRGDPALRCKILNGMAILAVEQNLLNDARSYCLTALEIAKRAQLAQWVGGVLGNLAFIDHSEGNTRDAIRRYEEALRLAEQSGDRRWEGNARCNLGLLLHEQGQWSEAETELAAALTIAREIGHRRLECTALCNLGLVFEALGDRERALDRLQASVTLAATLRDVRTEAQFGVLLGELLARTGRYADALDCLERAEAILNGIGNPVALATVLCAKAEVALLAGLTDKARDAFVCAEACLSTSAAAQVPEASARLAQLRPKFCKPEKRD